MNKAYLQAMALEPDQRRGSGVLLLADVLESIPIAICLDQERKQDKREGEDENQLFPA